MAEPRRRRIVVDRVPMVAYQISAFFHEKRYAWIEGTTKSGKTYTAIAWLVEQSVVGTFRNYWWVAPTQGASDIAYTRMKNAIAKGLRKTNDTARTITLPNGHVLWFKSGEKPDNLYGEDVGAVVIDEASRLRESAWWAVRSVVTFTRGKVRAIGNVKGRQNWFFKKCRAAEAALASSTPTDAHYAIITAADAVRAGILPQAEIDDAERELPRDVFMELYFGVPTKNGSNPFGAEFIADCATLDAPTGLPAAARGLDIARAVDWAVLLGLDADGAVADFERFQKPWEEFYEAVYRVVDIDDAPTLADSTGLGDVVVSRLQRDRPRRFEGYKFTSESKQKLMEGLAVAIQKGEVKIPRSGPIRAELEQFEFEYTRSGGVRYAAPEGFHDDCVVAMALAVAARTRAVIRQEGRVYQNWGDANELSELPPYHRECWERGRVLVSHLIAPSDRRPWAMIWAATFPNKDSVVFAEWPALDLAAFSGGCADGPEDYRALVIETEATIGYQVAKGRRLGSPEYFGDDEGGLRMILGRPCHACLKAHSRDEVFKLCRHQLFVQTAPDVSPPNHALVRAALGDPKIGTRPRHFALKDACPNYCFALRNYGYVEEKRPENGTNERPARRDRGMAELARFFFDAKLDRWPEAVAGLALSAPRFQSHATRADEARRRGRS